MEVTVSYLLMGKKYISSKQKLRYKNYALCLGFFLKILKLIIFQKNRINRVVKVFSVNFDPIDANNILYIYKYLMKKDIWY